MSVGLFLIIVLVILLINNIINKIVKIIEWKIQYLTSKESFIEDDEL